MITKITKFEVGADTGCKVEQNSADKNILV